MAVLCREFDISRKTGYKILTRYNDSGLEGLTDRSRRPYRHANQLPFQIEKRGSALSGPTVPRSVGVRWVELPDLTDSGQGVGVG